MIPRQDAFPRPLLLDRAIPQVTNVRITDFNGCSLSSLSKSVVSVDPPGADADALRTWYTTAELTADRFTPVGQDLAGSRVPGCVGYMTRRDQ